MENEVFNFGEIFSDANQQEIKTVNKNSLGQTIDTNGMYLKEISFVRVIGGKREHLRTIPVKIDNVPDDEKITEYAEPFTKYGAVMVLKIYERVEMQLEHNPDYEKPVDRHVPLRQIRRNQQLGGQMHIKGNRFKARG